MVHPTKDTGDLSEAKAIAALTEKGFSVSVPLSENVRYDLIADDGDKLIRVQVKTGWYSSQVGKDEGGIRIACASNHASGHCITYTKDDADVLMAYDPKLDRFYWIPIEETNKTQMTLNVEGIGKPPGTRSRLAKDYLFEDV